MKEEYCKPCNAIRAFDSEGCTICSYNRDAERAAEAKQEWESKTEKEKKKQRNKECYERNKRFGRSEEYKERDKARSKERYKTISESRKNEKTVKEMKKLLLQGTVNIIDFINYVQNPTGNVIIWKGKSHFS